MKASELKALLNNTGYAVHYSDGKVCVGSPMCSDLISVKNGKVRYALDTWNSGRESLDRKEELGQIWDKLEELIASGELDRIIAENDPTDGMIQVFTFDGDKVVEKYADTCEWPSVTHDGELIYSNTFFTERAKAVEYGKRDTQLYIGLLEEQIIEAEKKVAERKKMLEERKAVLKSLNTPNQ